MIIKASNLNKNTDYKMVDDEHSVNDWSEDNSQHSFGVIAEKKDYSKQLILTELSFARLVDEIIVPYQNDKPFFIDGVPVTKKNIDRIKIIKLLDSYHRALRDLDLGLTRSRSETKQMYGDQYITRFDHIIRVNSLDITSQVIQAYDQKIKPNIKDYLPKREELISGAWSIFVETMKQLN